ALNPSFLRRVRNIPCFRCRKSTHPSLPAHFTQLTALLLRHFFAFLSRFRKSDGDGLLATGHLLSTATTLQGAALFLMHGTVNILRGGFRVFTCHRELHDVINHW